MDGDVRGDGQLASCGISRRVQGGFGPSNGSQTVGGENQGAFRLSSVLEPRESPHRDSRLQRVVARLAERQPLARVRGSGQHLAEVAPLTRRRSRC